MSVIATTTNLKTGDYVVDDQFGEFVVLEPAFAQDYAEVADTSDQSFVDTEFKGVYAQFKVVTRDGVQHDLFCDPERFWTIAGVVAVA